MIKYRPHRGGMSEAMEEAKEFDSIDDVKVYVYQQHKELHGKAPFGLDDIVIGEAVGDDSRIGWKNVRQVCVKRYFADDYMAKYGCAQCIGWCGE